MASLRAVCENFTCIPAVLDHMCTFQTFTIAKLDNEDAVLQNGRKVKTAGVSDLHIGDKVNVYADIIIEKIEEG
ncbi:MAG: hypothetical protein UV59_C0012G0021 [Candidatus Gottesmanbacteria bacterium GW2011_GWA1_43_11]|uniref:Uncharacterized protein n=1 Tax=Candidatus Gottesmanbacteria bacterium GW2011_GWA1_43_11 TaxID=1618436 RepID=A0A0G1FDJ0_9BACT|nr:MAG: hypothetical protein UV59_C0012G0021 [Candidatus Gottesmanbacteria bacterium GW2011_GWA1_43_11]